MSTYLPADDRYRSMTYRRCGRSGLLLPAVSLGLWHNFGDDKPFETQRAILRRAFDLGITHFDLANNYGPPYGCAETNFGRHLREDFRAYRDELVISTKAGWDMWPGPYGDLGSRKYLAGQPRPALQRMRPGLRRHLLPPPLRPGHPARGDDGRARRRRPRRARRSTSASPPTPASAPPRPYGSCGELGTPLLIHQPSYSMLNRWIEEDLLDVLGREGVGLHRVLAAGAGHADRPLPRRHPGRLAGLGGGLAQSRACSASDNMTHIRALNDIAERRGQSLAQMASRGRCATTRVTSVLIGASSVAQLEQNVAALDNLDFTAEELATIDRYAVEGGIDLWRTPATA